MVLLKVLILLCLYINIVDTGKFEHYRGKIERLVILNIDEKLGKGNVSMSKFNKTSIGVSMFADLYQDLSDEVFIDLQLYAEFSNQYRRMPYNFNQLNMCDQFQYIHTFIEDHINKCGYFPSKCPIKKDKYVVKNYVLHDKVLPNFPWNKVMYEVNLTAYNRVLLTIRCYITMDHDTDIINKALGI